MEHGSDYYEILGVSRDASPRDLKKGYFALIRKHTPEDDPVHFRLISEAYSTLSNPEKRKEYDQRETMPEEANRLITEIFENIEEEDFLEAEELARDLVDRFGSFKTASLTAAIALHRAGEDADSEAILERLEDEHPTDGVILKWRAIVLAELGQNSFAIDKFKESIVLDPFESDTYLSFAQVVGTLDDYLSRQLMGKEAKEASLEILERGINADGVVDVQDLPLFIRKIFIYSTDRDWDAMKREARRLIGSVPVNDEDASAYVCHHFFQLAKLYDSLALPHLTEFAIECAQKVDPSNETLAEIKEGISESAALHRDIEGLFADDSIAEWIKALVACLINDDKTEEEGHNVFVNIAMLVAQNRSKSTSEWQRFRSKYPKATEGAEQAKTSIFNAANEMARGSTSGHSSRHASSSSGATGCLVFIAALALGCIQLVLMLTGWSL